MLCQLHVFYIPILLFKTCLCLLMYKLLSLEFIKSNLVLLGLCLFILRNSSLTQVHKNILLYFLLNEFRFFFLGFSPPGILCSYICAGIYVYMVDIYFYLFHNWIITIICNYTCHMSLFQNSQFCANDRFVNLPALIPNTILSYLIWF